MLDWNHDGKMDYKDHAFYNNVVEPGMKKSVNSSSNGSKNGSKNSFYSFSSTEGSGSGIKIFVGIWVLYLIIKLIGS